MVIDGVSALRTILSAGTPSITMLEGSTQHLVYKKYVQITSEGNWARST